MKKKNKIELNIRFFNKCCYFITPNFALSLIIQWFASISGFHGINYFWGYPFRLLFIHVLDSVCFQRQMFIHKGLKNKLDHVSTTSFVSSKTLIRSQGAYCNSDIKSCWQKCLKERYEIVWCVDFGVEKFALKAINTGKWSFRPNYGISIELIFVSILQLIWSIRVFDIEVFLVGWLTFWKPDGSKYSNHDFLICSFNESLLKSPGKKKSFRVSSTFSTNISKFSFQSMVSFVCRYNTPPNKHFDFFKRKKLSNIKHSISVLSSSILCSLHTRYHHLAHSVLLI